jgi:hypothetical protein
VRVEVCCEDESPEPSAPADLLASAVFDLDAGFLPCAAGLTLPVRDSKGGIEFGSRATADDGDGVRYWDLTEDYLTKSGGPERVESVQYTHAYVLKWRESDASWRTLLRHSHDHCAIVNHNSKRLGFFSSRHGSFRDSGYDILPQQDRWEVVVVTGQAESTFFVHNVGVVPSGTSTFFVQNESGMLTKVGTADRVCTGMHFAHVGFAGQGPGKISRVMAWDRVLTDEEIRALPSLLLATREARAVGAPELSCTESSAVFDLDPSRQSCFLVKESKAGIEFGSKATVDDGDGVRYWDLTTSYLERSGGPERVESLQYTHAYVLKWRESDASWRTLLRHSHGHGICAIVNHNTKRLGFFSFRDGAGAFRDSGYDILPQQDRWEVVVVRPSGVERPLWDVDFFRAERERNAYESRHR